jgi:hypothetical protein
LRAHFNGSDETAELTRKGKGQSAMKINDLNETLAGRKLLSVEEGSTPGWMVFNFEPPPDWPEGVKMYFTIWVGGRKQQGHEDHHHWTAAFHAMAKDGVGTADPVRDERDPAMPMASRGAAKSCDFILPFRKGHEEDQFCRMTATRQLGECWYCQLHYDAMVAAEAEKARAGGM